MTKALTGGILVAAGVLTIAVVYSFRPPSGMMDAFNMMARGRETFIQEPAYEIFMAVGAIVAAFGAVLLGMGLRNRNVVVSDKGRASGESSMD